MNSSHLRIIGLLSVFAAMLCLASCGGGQDTEAAVTPEPKLVSVEVDVIEPSVIRDILVLPGTTEPDEDIQVSAEYGGQVEWVGPVEGQTVQKDEELAKIDVTILNAQLNRAQANFKLADELASRRQDLFKKGMISREQLDQALTDRIDALNSLREAQEQLSQAQVTSPIKGVVNYLYVDEGEFVGRGSPIMDIVNTEKIKVMVQVPELDVRYLSEGQKARITVDAYPEEEWFGEIDYVSYKADPATKTFEVRVVMDNRDGLVRPGMFARAFFLRRTIENAISVPLYALLDKGGERLIFVEENGVAHARTVTLGVIEGDRIQVVEGLEAGDKLIVKGHTMVEEGVEVDVQ